MFCVTLLVGATPFRFMFRTEEPARVSCNALTQVRMIGGHAMVSQDWFSMVDDFGQEIHCPYASVSGFAVEDLDKSKLCHIELALHQQRTQIAAQKQAETDPILRQQRAGMNGPGVITPFGRN